MYSEFSLIEFIKNCQPTLPKHIEGIGDDCAIIFRGEENQADEQVVTCDTMVENIHFLRAAISPYELGRKAVTTNLSDIAAMGAKPESIILALSIPKGITNDYLEEFIKGVNSWGVPVIGGDTTKSPEHFVITITAMGRVMRNNIKRRSTAQVGDVIYLSGTVGDSAAGLHAILNDLTCQPLVFAHNNPTPHISVALELAPQENVHAMMDVSDGVASDLVHILKASGVGAEIDTAMIPMSGHFKDYCKVNNLNPVELAVTGGEDYVLLFTASDKVMCHCDLYPIGKIVEGAPQINWIGEDIRKSGFTHF